MAYYKITILLRDNNKALVGIRELQNTDVDYAWRHFKQKTELNYTAYKLLFFEVVQLSKLSPDVQAYLKSAKRPPVE